MSTAAPAIPAGHLLLLATPAPAKEALVARPSACPRTACSDEMELRCLIKGARWAEAWLPDRQTLQRVAADGTVFVSIFRHEPALQRLDEMWFNMLWHFSRAVKNTTLLLGMSACPAPGFEHVSGMNGYEPVRDKRGGTLPLGTVTCHPLPFPCDCPQKALHARCKFIMILALLKQGLDVFWMDSDTALLQNPLSLPFPPLIDMMGCYENTYHLNLGMLRVRATAPSVKGLERAIFTLDNEKLLERAVRNSKVPMHPWLYEQAVIAQQFNLRGLHNKVCCVSKEEEEEKMS